MSRKELTMDRVSEIKRQLSLGIPIIQISQNLKCTERTVRLIRDGQITDAKSHHKISHGPLWIERMNWNDILAEIIDGHPFSLVWEEVAKDVVGYKAFLDQFHKKFPNYKKAFIVHRHFAPGDRCEVDYAGDKVEWIDVSTGAVHEAVIFVGILGFSQKIYAEATEDQQGRNFVRSHVRMYNYFGGVPRITVPDCLKQGVTRCHRYDPEINRSYGAMASEFNTVIVPARPRRPKDKALVEGAVKIVMRYFRWKCRRHIFLSLKEINDTLLEVCREINLKPHSRFKISREVSWQEKERSALQSLPEVDYEFAEYKTAKVHDDSHISYSWTYYSVPHQYRGMKVDLKITEKTMEVFFDNQRIALHRKINNHGEYVTDISHLPDNAKAYHEATPQNLLSQAKFLDPDLHILIDELFQKNALGNLRRAQGFIRLVRSEYEMIGKDRASHHLKEAISTMRRFNKIFVPYLKSLLDAKRKQTLGNQIDPFKINRQANENIRYSQQLTH